MDRLTKPLASLGDTELIRASRDDPAAFEVLFDRHAMVLRQWLYAQTRDATVAQDLLAETFAQAWLARSRFRGDGERSGAAWLYGIARNLTLHHHRRGRVESSGRRKLGMSLTTQGDDGGIEELVGEIHADELSDAVNEAFAALSPAQRSAIGYRVLADLSYADIAARLHCSPVTARTRVLRGLQAMRTAVAKEEHP
jgi:RNA polymerase sigma factor (sigma-70 family)